MPQTTTVDNPTSTSTISTTSTNTATPHHPPTPTAHNDYATELQALQSEINELKKMLTTAVEEFKTAIVSLTATPRALPPSNVMETETEELTDQHHPTPTSPDLAAIVNDLKHELASFVLETRNLLQQNRTFISFQPTPFPT